MASGDGTTRTAKGVPLNHRNLAFQLNTLLEADLVAEDDRVTLPLPLHHVYPFVVRMPTPLAAGLPIIMPYSPTGPQIVRALQKGPFVITPNHVSYLDSFVVGAALDYRRLRGTYWAGWSGAAFGNLVTRTVSRLAQAVPIDPARVGYVEPRLRCRGLAA
ncbi:MAG: hypothetical protein AVDCRST_MAG14-969 [uncultured Rubrobacteraceae bacterium]|uniref:AMP-dependent synthetase/ligase domain-containing protein n=1 Tax=uncultured Rubrobacteraceae bacterium TaxID=349277 RepID=A0A6J4QZR6_9ACTN|nr:MAG: hypothetical protein AVDCRST_MAG14-969 [uncultured Rubrobacteraceae bacterium]